MQFAPVGGEGFTATAAAAHPGGAANRVGGSTPVMRAPYRVGINSPNHGSSNQGNEPRSGSNPGREPVFHPRNNEGNRNISPPSRPAPVFRPMPRPAPRPMPMPRPAPEFHPAPMPHFSAPPAFHSAPHPASHPHR